MGLIKIFVPVMCALERDLKEIFQYVKIFVRSRDFELPQSCSRHCIVDSPFLYVWGSTFKNRSLKPFPKMSIIHLYAKSVNSTKTVNIYSEFYDTVQIHITYLTDNSIIY